MSFLIDTDIIIDFQNKKNPGFTYFKSSVKKDAFISIISYSEIVYGMQGFTHKQALIAKFEKMLEDFGISVLPINKQIGLNYAQLKFYLQQKKKLLQDFDIIIASSAITNNLTLVTRNTKHFSRIPDLALFNLLALQSGRRR